MVQMHPALWDNSDADYADKIIEKLCAVIRKFFVQQSVCTFFSTALVNGMRPQFSITFLISFPSQIQHC